MVAFGDNRLPDRFWDKVVPQQSGCWWWRARRCPQGYGYVSDAGATRQAHRLAYTRLVGEIPTGLHLDHLCHTSDSSCPGGVRCLHRRCVNPEHLEPVTGDENARRSVPAQKTHCINGHEFTPANTYDRSRNAGKGGVRGCRACNRDAVARYQARKRAA